MLQQTFIHIPGIGIPIPSKNVQVSRTGFAVSRGLIGSSQSAPSPSIQSAMITLTATAFSDSFLIGKELSSSEKTRSYL
jgi:hypothetical protein